MDPKSQHIVMALLAYLAILWLMIAEPASAQEMEAADYTNYTLFRFEQETWPQLDRLKFLRDLLKLDFWSEPRSPGLPVMAHVPPKRSSLVILGALLLEIPYEKVSDNLQELVDEQRSESQVLQRSRSSRSGSRYETYYPYNQLIQLYSSLAKANPRKVKMETIGSTFRGEKMYAITISNGRTEPGRRPAVMFECGIHAREWVSPASCLWIANEVIQRPAPWMNRYDLVIIPSANPDGYKVTWTSRRLWRKNVSNKHSRTCIGVDLNRNFETPNFGKGNQQGGKCSETYPGPVPFSEPETRAIRDYVLKRQPGFVTYFAIHSYTQLWMYPYGFEKGTPSNGEELEDRSEAAVAAIKAVHGEDYKYGPIAITIYEAPGSSSDWAYVGAKIQRAYAIELRDKGQYGFLLPARFIKPTLEEFLAGVNAAMKGL